MKDNTIYLFAGGANSVEGAVKTELHEIGHHTLEAYDQAVRGNKPEAEDAADKYMNTMYSKIMEFNKP